MSRVIHFELAVDDPARARAFYEQTWYRRLSIVSCCRLRVVPQASGPVDEPGAIKNHRTAHREQQLVYSPSQQPGDRFGGCGYKR